MFYLKYFLMAFQFDSRSDYLFEGILMLQDKGECEKFFRDLCTISEIKSMVERFAIVKALREGKSYRVIAKEVGASTTTVTRVAHWLEQGEGGYKMVADRLEKK